MTAGYFDNKIGPLKRAAIDAWMKSHSGGHWQIQGDRYVIDTSDGDSYVTRPGENGEGGGDWETDNFIADLFGVDRDDEFTSKFNEIRTMIDQALNRWRDIPNEATLSTQIEAMRQANRKLSVSAETTDGAVTGGGAIGGDLDLILENSVAMSGGMITAFKSNFLAQLGRAIGGQHAITLILGGHLAAQAKMWGAARQTVVEIVDSATKSFNAAAQGGEVDWAVVLKVVGYAVSGASIFATAGAKQALDATGLGLTILAGALPTDPEGTKKPAANYESVMDAFLRDLTALDEKITDEERIIRGNLNTNLGQIRSDQGSYDLARPPLLDVDDGNDLYFNADGQREEINIDHGLVKEITNTYMPNVAGELSAAMAEVDKAVDLGLHRDATIGIGQSGPSAEYYELRFLLWELLGNLESEVRYSAKTLELAVADLTQADSETQAALANHAKEVDDARVGESGGAMYDPWNVVTAEPR